MERIILTVIMLFFGASLMSNPDISPDDGISVAQEDLIVSEPGELPANVLFQDYSEWELLINGNNDPQPELWQHTTTEGSIEGNYYFGHPDDKYQWGPDKRDNSPVPCPGMASFTDPRDQQVYPTIEINGHCLMNRNMNYNMANSWCFEENSAMCNAYGRLYNWAAATQACPTGWKLPSTDDWAEIERGICQFLGNENCNTAFPYFPVGSGFYGTNEGWAMKSCFQPGSSINHCDTDQHPFWTSGAGSDHSGFSVHPAGRREYISFTHPINWIGMGTTATFWSSDQHWIGGGTFPSSHHAYAREFRHNTSQIVRSTVSKVHAISVRCIRVEGFHIVPPAVVTKSAQVLSTTTAKVESEVTFAGTPPLNQRGVVYSTSPEPTFSENDGFTNNGDEVGEFTSNLTNLTPGTVYYVRAYAKHVNGVEYGSQLSFMTYASEDHPILTTREAFDITIATAKSGGNITHEGSSPVIARGVVWSQSAYPGLESNLGLTSDGEGGGEFISQITDILPHRTYYVRAYATNSEGTGYGNQISFSTDIDLTLPEVITTPVTQVTATSAMSGGEVISTGGLSVSYKGVVWDTSPSPVIFEGEGLTEDGDGIGEFTSEVTGLTPNTTYYLRAYARSGAGIAYGHEETFQTSGEDNFFINEYHSLADNEVPENWTLNVVSGNVSLENGRLQAVPQNATGRLVREGVMPSTVKSLTCQWTGNLSYSWSGMHNQLIIHHGDGSHFTIYASTSAQQYGNSENRIYILHNGEELLNESIEKKQGIFDFSVSLTDDLILFDGITYNDQPYFSIQFPLPEHIAFSLSEVTSIWYQVHTTTENSNWLNNISIALSEEDNPPYVTTDSVSEIAQKTALVYGNAILGGTGDIIAKGLVWGLNDTPTLQSNLGMVTVGAGTGEFYGYMTDLVPGTNYYVRVFATNASHTSYGHSIGLTTLGMEDITWADYVIDFSSEYNTEEWSAWHALGQPVVYPEYGDIPGAWSSLHSYDQREYLELGYLTPGTASKIYIYETFTAGAVDTVYVRDYYTHEWYVVWSGTAGPLPPMARIFEISFEPTAHSIDGVRLAINSPAVPGWNQIDAVGVKFDELEEFIDPDLYFAGGTGTESDPWLIETAENLNNVRHFTGEQHQDKFFRQIANIDLGVAPWNEGEGWDPIGQFYGIDHEDNKYFCGWYDGNGYQINNMVINRPQTKGVGLFSVIKGAVLLNIRLNDVSITGHQMVGGLVGISSTFTFIQNNYISGSVTGHKYVGGLIGINSGSIFTCGAEVQVSAMNYGGGIAAKCHGNVFLSWSTGSVSCTMDVAGGLFGKKASGQLSNSYSTASVSGGNFVGGLIGLRESGTDISYCYSTGAVLSDSINKGGLIGFSFADDPVASYWNIITSGVFTSFGGEGKSTVEMITQSTFEDWDFESFWNIAEGSTYPWLTWQLAPADHNYPDLDGSALSIYAVADPNDGGTINGIQPFIYSAQEGEQIELLAVPAFGYQFSHWEAGGEIVSTHPQYSFTASAHLDLIASFTPLYFTIEVNQVPEGGIAGMVIGGGGWLYGTETVVFASPNSYFTFEHWVKDGEVVSTNLSFVFTVTGNHVLTAHFSGAEHQITSEVFPAETGSVTGQGSYWQGEKVTLETESAPGFHVLRWLDGDDQVSVINPYVFSAQNDRHLVAHMWPSWWENEESQKNNDVLITAGSVPSQIGVVIGQGYYAEGEEVTLVASPNAGVEFSHWLDENDQIIYSDDNTMQGDVFTFMATADNNFTAVFEGETYSVSVEKVPLQGGEINIEDTDSFYYGEFVMLAANPAPGYEFHKWTDGIDGPQISVLPSFGFTVSDDRNLAAHFTPLELYSIIKLHDTEGVAGEQITINMEIINGAEFSGFNLDIPLPDGFSFVEDSEILYRADDHLLSVVVLAGNVVRIISTSPTNAAFSGNEGTVVSFGLLTPQGEGGSFTLPVTNAVIGNAAGENVLTGTIDANILLESSEEPPVYEYLMIVHDAEGVAGEQITVNLEIANEAGFVGFNLDIPLPAGFSFQAGSEQLFRGTNHTLSATVLSGNVLRMIAVSADNSSFAGQQGTVVSFALQTPVGEDGTFTLPVTNAIIGNAVGENVLTEIIDGVITLEASEPPPVFEYHMLLQNAEANAGQQVVIHLDITNEADFVGFNLDIPLPAGFSFQPGSEQLFRGTNHTLSANVISGNVLRMIAVSADNSAFTGQQGTVVSFALQTPMVEGTFPLNIENAVIGNAFGQDVLTSAAGGNITLTLDETLEYHLVLHDAEAESGQTLTLEIEIVNEGEFVGFNLDIPLPDGFTFVQGSEILFRKTDHFLSVSLLTGNILRLISTSLTNAAYLGSEGIIAGFDVQTSSSPGNYPVTPINAVIGNAHGQNVLTEVFGGTVVLTEPPIVDGPVNIIRGGPSDTNPLAIPVQIAGVGANPFNTNLNQWTGSWQAPQAIYDQGEFVDHPLFWSNIQGNPNAGSTWVNPHPGEGYGILVVDLQQVRQIYNVSVFQMFSDGKITHIALQKHAEAGANPPDALDAGWEDFLPISPVYGGADSTQYVAAPTQFSMDATTRYVKIIAKNDGSLGDSWYIELKGIKMYGQESIPVVLTQVPASVTENSVTTGGEVIYMGDEDVTARGVVWDTIPGATLDAALGFTSDGIGTGTFESVITGLDVSTTYYVRAYASNVKGTAYGTTYSVTTLGEEPGVYYLTLQHYPENINPVMHGAGYHTEDEAVTISTSGVPGYRFSYWYGDAEDMALVDNFLAMITSLTMPARDVTLTALYEPVTALGEEAAASLHIYPNPFHSRINIDHVQPFSRIEITDMLGAKVFSVEIGEEGSIKLDLGYLRAGLYFIHAIDMHGQASTEILIKQ